LVVTMTTDSISLDELATVTGGAGTPLSGDVSQQIITNWGGNQIVNVGPKLPTHIFEYMRQNPAARLDAIRRQSR
jgi:hypothetical protein